MRQHYNRAERDFIKKHGRSVLNQIKTELELQIPTNWIASMFQISERDIISINDWYLKEKSDHNM